MTATYWWVVVPPSEQGASSVPSDAKILATPENSKQYNTLLNTDKGTVTVGGHQYVRYMGPFHTKAEAQSATPGNLDILGIGITTAINQLSGKPLDKQTIAQDAGGHLPNPLKGLDAIGGFFNALTNPHTWVRILMVGGGVVLMTAGLMQMFPKVNEATLGVLTKTAGRLPGI